MENNLETCIAKILQKEMPLYILHFVRHSINKFIIVLPGCGGKEGGTKFPTKLFGELLEYLFLLFDIMFVKGLDPIG